MKLFTTTRLTGINPVGTAAIVIAKDIDQAVMVLQNRVDSSELAGLDGNVVTKEMLIPVKLNQESALILQNGDY